MLEHFEERRTALQQVRKCLDSKASLQTQSGRQYIRCLALLVGTEMQIEELKDMEKGRIASTPHR